MENNKKSIVIKGDIISSDSISDLRLIEDGYICLNEGRIESVSETLPDEYKDVQVADYSGKMIMQSFCDMHIHAPQYPMIGLGMDKPLVEWLDSYAFPMESRFEDVDYARRVYRKLAADLIESGTTRVAMFSSIHREATIVLMEELEKAGVTGYVGKVNMDRNGGPDLEETTEESKMETLKWLEESNSFEHIKPILTPRFVPSCTNEIMEFLGELSGERSLPVQSHISENFDEIAWVKELRPDSREYWEAYYNSGLWHDRTLMAHCVHSSQRERQAMKKYGVTAVHCCNSNMNLCSGIMPLRLMMDEGLKVALGSDASGGNTINGFDVVADTVQASKARSIMEQGKIAPLSETEVWYLASSAPADWFGMSKGFAAGDYLHAVVIDDSELLCDGLTLKERFQRCFYKRQKEAVRAVWSEGRLVYEV